MGIPPHKHIIQNTNSAVAGATTQTQVLAVGTENPDPYTNPTNVRNGSIIRSIELQIDMMMNAGTASTFTDFVDWYLWYNINGAQSAPSPYNVNASHLKNQVFHMDGCMFETLSTGIAYSSGYTQTRTWRVRIHIPRGYQTIQLGDQIELKYYRSGSPANFDIKVTAIYKEIYP